MYRASYMVYLRVKLVTWCALLLLAAEVKSMVLYLGGV